MNQRSYEYIYGKIAESGCELLTDKIDYINTHQDLLIQCICGEKFICSYFKFNYKKYKMCDKCLSKNRNRKNSNKGIIKNSIEYYKNKKLEYPNLESYEILDVYKEDGRLRIKYLHKTCNNISSSILSSFYSKKSVNCENCYSNKQYTHEEFIEKIKQVHGNKYTILGQYKNNKIPILVRHNICNYEWKIHPQSLYKIKTCPYCSGKIRDTDQFHREVEDLTNNEYKCLDEFISTTDSVRILHKKCNYITTMKPIEFLSGRRCQECTYIKRIKKRTSNIEEFKQKVYKLVGEEYFIPNQDYINAKTKIEIKHNICNYTYKVTPDNFLRGRRCPVCAESLGEQAIRHWLENNCIWFISEYDKFLDLLSDLGNPLRFDFIVFKDKEKSKIKMLIEYDGIQHYEWQDGWQTKESFETLQIHDKRKNQYCEKHNIKLLRIPYWEFDNIEEILNNVFCLDWLEVGDRLL